MTDTTPKFDPIPRLQQIAATIEESGADIFDAPATAVHYIECAIKEIERLREERDEARRIACNREAELNRMMFDNPKYSDSVAIAKQRGWDCFKENT